jgi:hypothetical protein
VSSFGGSSPGPTAQQQALQTEQATTNANLNLQENEQRKVILNAMQGTRVFRGSALSRAIAGNTPGTGVPQAPGGPSGLQNAPLGTAAAGNSLLDQFGAAVPGSTGASRGGGVGAGGTAATRGGGVGGSGRGGIAP